MQKDRESEKNTTIDKLRKQGTIQIYVEKDGKATVEFIPNRGKDLGEYVNTLPIPKEDI